jgi:hypothetical protein
VVTPDVLFSMDPVKLGNQDQRWSVSVIKERSMCVAIVIAIEEQKQHLMIGTTLEARYVVNLKDEDRWGKRQGPQNWKRKSL